MKKYIIALALSAICAAPVFATDYRWEQTNPNPYANPNPNAPKEIEIRKSYDFNQTDKYRGEVERDGSVRAKNWNGDTLRGTIEPDGYGRLRDQDGNTYRVKPR